MFHRVQIWRLWRRMEHFRAFVEQIFLYNMGVMLGIVVLVKHKLPFDPKLFSIFTKLCCRRCRHFSFFMISSTNTNSPTPEADMYPHIITFPPVYRCGPGGSMHVCHIAGPGSNPGRDKFPGWDFSFFFSPVRQTSGSFRPPWFPEYHLAIIIILHHSLRAPIIWDVDAP